MPGTFAGDFPLPFSLSTTPEDPSAAGYPVSIDGIGYVLDMMAEPSRTAIKVVQSRQSVYAQVMSDSLLLPPEVWRRSRESWHQGDHQTNGDREDSLPYRFSSSRGVNVWNKWKLSLLHDTTSKVATTGSAPWVGVIAGQLCVVEGTNLRWYANAGAAAVSYVLTSAAVSVTQNGRAVFIALAGGNVVTAVPGADVTAFATLASVSLVAYVKDFLVAAAGNVLYDITTGTPTAIRTHPITQFTWVAATEGLSCIYLLGGAGDSWVIHRLTVADTGASLNPPIVSAMLPDGETGYSLGSYMGYLFVGTSKGLRFGISQANGDVTLGPLITTTSPVRCFEGQDRYVWYGLTNVDGTSTGLGRVDLTTFTEPLAPASATDLMAPVQGDVTAVTTWLGKTVFAVAGQAVYIEADTLVASGWLVESDIAFGIPDQKIAHYSRLRTEPMNGDVHLYFAYDGSATLVDTARVTDVNATDSGNSYLDGVTFGKVSAKLVLDRSTTDATKGPVVTRWEIRCEPVTGKGSEWNLPVIIADELEVNGLRTMRDVDEDVSTLIGLVESGKVVSYREGSLAWQVHMVDYVFKPLMKSTVRNGFQGTLTLLAREVK